MTSGILPFGADTLNLEYTLMSGQAFRWQRDSEGGWSCLLTCAQAGETREVFVRLRQDAQQTWYESSQDEAETLVRDYFRLDVDFPTLAAQFTARDERLGAAVARFPGLRVLRQDPVENLFSFLCTSAAPLHRIRRSIDGLCRTYGEQAGTANPGGVYYSFPTVEALADADVMEMKTLGLGYRARYIQAVARRILDLGGAPWLRALRASSYADAKAALVTLPGVGEKIADCVCLFSLGQDAAIPVDTHIRRIAARDYGVGTEGRSLTPSVYAQIGDTLRTRFGPMAGWAQQFLFLQELYGKGAWDAYAALYR